MKITLQLAILAGIAVMLQVTDLVTAVQMLVQYGPQAELNPLVRGVYELIGPLGVGIFKVIPMAAILVLSGVGLRGRPYLGRNLLALTVMLGAVATRSNVL